MSLFKFLLVAASAASSAWSAHGLQQQGTAVGRNFSLVLVGGGLDDNNDEIWNTIISLGGGAGIARFGVLSAASENPCCDEESSWVYYRDQLTRYGAKEVYYIPVTVDTKGNNSDPDVVARVKSLTGFFLGGGDQARIIYSLYNDGERVPSPVLTAMKEALLATGGVLAGTSAGTDCQTSKVMIEGGSSYEGLRDGTTLFWRSIHSRDESALAGYGPGGLGFFPHGLVDTHFSNRGRHGRLVKLLVDSALLPAGHTRAYGVDENTALVVTGPWEKRVGTIIGERGVVVFDTSKAIVDGQDISNIWNARLTEKDSIDLNSLEVTFAPFKSLMAAREVDLSPKASLDIFREGTFEVDGVSLSLFQSTHRGVESVTLQKSPQFRVEMKKDAAMEEGAQAVAADGVNPLTGIYYFSYQGLTLNMLSFDVDK